MKPTNAIRRLLPIILTLSCFGRTVAQNIVIDTIAQSADTTKHLKYVKISVEEPKQTFFQGFSVAADIVSPIQYAVSGYGGVEAALRVNLLNTYFPVVEAGYAKYDKTDDNTGIRFATAAPFFRVGFDINLLKNKFQENRLFLGARYGLSFYDYDISGPEIVDPVWGGSEPFAYNGISTTSHWMELLASVQVKVWRNFHMGWSIRYKRELSSTKSIYSKPYYIPGYGTTTNKSAWGATYSLIFDLNWGKKQPKNNP